MEKNSCHLDGCNSMCRIFVLVYDMMSASEKNALVRSASGEDGSCADFALDIMSASEKK